MKRRTILSLAAFGLIAAGAPAMAQAKKPVRTASIPPSPPAQPTVANTTGLPPANMPGSPVPTSNAAAPVYGSPQIVQVTYYPTVVLADGRVLANFGTGRGYEEVLRQCPQLTGTLPPNATIAPCWTRDTYGTYRVMQKR
jgi:hypothetical protein